MIYLDSNATTPVLPEVWEAMRPYFLEHFGNPASSHRVGKKARQALENAREQIASLLDAYPDEVLFTSGATESNNLAIYGLLSNPQDGLAFGAVEHPCVRGPAERLQTLGHPVSEIAVDREGIFSSESVQASLAKSPQLVCLMLVNHETGAIQPVQEWAKKLPSGTALHCDAAQAVGKIPVRFHELGVTTLSASGHKFHGPKGVGLFLVKRETRLQSFMQGGHQQRGIRPGTESVPLAVGLAKALEICQSRREESWNQVEKLRTRLLDLLHQNAGPIVVNTPLSKSTPYTLNVSFPGCRAELLLMKLDMMGVACSTGSACSSGSLLPSPVLQAMGVPPEVLHSAMRFSFSSLLTVGEIEQAALRIGQAVQQIRADEEIDQDVPI